MDTTLIPVTEKEMNMFFQNITEGFAEFKARIATNFVAASEQAATIDALRQTVERLQNSVDAMTATVRQLTEDRDRAEAECRRAQQSERAALDIAAEVESQLSATKAHVAELTVALAHTNEAKFNLEIANAELREQNDRQKLTLADAVNENERLQAEIGRMRAGYEDKINIADTRYHGLHDSFQQATGANSQLQTEIKRLTNMLSVAKTVLEGVPIKEQNDGSVRYSDRQSAGEHTWVSPLTQP